MYEIVFNNSIESEANVVSSGVSLECKNFSILCNELPSDRHNYKLKFFMNPISIGRLPSSAKNFVKFVR